MADKGGFLDGFTLDGLLDKASDAYSKKKEAEAAQALKESVEKQQAMLEKDKDIQQNTKAAELKQEQEAARLDAQFIRGVDNTKLMMAGGAVFSLLILLVVIRK